MTHEYGPRAYSHGRSQLCRQTPVWIIRPRGGWCWSSEDGMRTADISTNFHQCCAAETSHSHWRRCCSNQKVGGTRPPRSPWLLRLCHRCGSTLCDWSDRTVWQHPLPLPPKNFLLGSRRIPWPGRIGVEGGHVHATEDVITIQCNCEMK